MTERKKVDIKIRRLKIVNYKGIDQLELDFPAPGMLGDPDVMVMGSRNGLGKTSVLECCALLLLALSRRDPMIYDMPERSVRAGTATAQIRGEIKLGQIILSCDVTIYSSGQVARDISEKHLDELEKVFGRDEMYRIAHDFVGTCKGLDPNPFILSSFIYLHSYRQIREVKPEFSMMIGGQIPSSDDVHRLPPSIFKLIVLRSLMSQANLFEGESFDEESEDVLKKLNELVKRYAGGTIEKLRASADNTVDFRVHPVDGGPSFTFDGLSSGQKEIIATLFLIWHQTRHRPCVVLIDEPELHLNPEWHGDFIRQLIKLTPDNQFIIATHSEDVFASVDADRRILLQNFDGGGS